MLRDHGIGWPPAAVARHPRGGGLAARELVSRRSGPGAVPPPAPRAGPGDPAAARPRVAHHRSRLRRVRRDGPRRAAFPDRRGPPGRPLGRSASPRRRPRGGSDRVPPAGPPSAPAPDAAHRRAPRRAARAAPGGVVVPVHRPGHGTARHGPPSRRRGRRLLAPARGASHRDRRAARPARHGRGARRPSWREAAVGAGWRTFDLEPGSLFHLPARTPHAVVCRRRSLAITLTWARVAGPATDARRGDRPPSLGRGVRVRGADPPGEPAHAVGPGARCSPSGAPPRPRFACGPRTARGHACPGRHARGPRGSASCRALTATLAQAAGLSPLVGAGILGPRDLPLRIRPEDPSTLDGWRFA